MMCGNCLETGHPAKFCRKARYLHEKVRCKRCRQKGHHAKVCMLNLSCYKYHYMYMSVKYQQYYDATWLSTCLYVFTIDLYFIYHHLWCKCSLFCFHHIPIIKQSTSFQGTLKSCFQYLVNDHFYPVQNEVLITCVPVRNHSMFAILRYFRIVMNFGDNGIALSK